MIDESMSAADVAIEWLDTIHLETLRDESTDCGERVRMLLRMAANHIRIRERMIIEREGVY